MKTRKSKIFMCDDEEGLCQLIADLLELDGYETFYLTSKVEGLEWIKKHKPDLVITDINSPQISGIDFLRMIKSDPNIAECKVVIFTGMGGLRDQALRLGAIAYFNKGVEGFDFVEAIKKIIPPELETEVRRLKRKRILFLDDISTLGAFTAEEVAAAGYETIYMDSKIVALSYLQSYPVDLIVTDIKSPGMSGLEFLSKVKTNPNLSSTPVMMLTANDDLSIAMNCVRLGAVDYLVKPYDSEDLLETLNRLAPKELHTNSVDCIETVVGVLRNGVDVVCHIFTPLTEPERNSVRTSDKMSEAMDMVDKYLAIFPDSLTTETMVDASKINESILRTFPDISILVTPTAMYYSRRFGTSGEGSRACILANTVIELCKPGKDGIA